MKTISYLRSKSDSFIALLKKKNKNNEDILIKSAHFCESCEEMTFQSQKLYKCNGCGKRIICKECHDEHKDICIKCDGELMSLYDRFEKAFKSMKKEKIEDFVDQLL